MQSSNSDAARGAGGSKEARPRDLYAEVGQALRDTILRALAEPGLVRSRRGRVLLAAIYLTASYSRVVDRLYVAQIAEVAQIPGDVQHRHTRRALNQLHKLGVIKWEAAERRGGRGRGKPSSLSLLDRDLTRPLLAALSGEKTGPIGSERPGQSDAKDPAATGPPTEKEVREDDDEDDATPVEFIELLERIERWDHLWEGQRRRALEAYLENPQGFEWCVRQAEAASSPGALLSSLLREGAHRRRRENGRAGELTPLKEILPPPAAPPPPTTTVSTSNGGAPLARREVESDEERSRRAEELRAWHATRFDGP